jgi:antitoxin (DNA-binding transcriptional repressor) of toxin-antitoxin stability system
VKTPHPHLKAIAASKVRLNFRDIIDGAQDGVSYLVLRNKKEVAAIVPARDARIFPLIRRIMNQLGESLLMSKDPSIVAALKQGLREAKQGRTTTYRL